jgi:signal transduction histidine kinase
VGAVVNLSTAAADGRPDVARVSRARVRAALTGALLAGLLLVTAVGLVSQWEVSHWQPVWLVLVLTGVTLIGELHAVRIGNVYVSSTSCALLLALALLGPAPAIAIALGTVAIDWLVNGKSRWAGLANVAIAGAATFAGAIAFEALTLADPAEDAAGQIAGAVLAAGAVMAAANLLALGAYRQLRLEESFRRALADTYLPTIPYHLLGMTLAAGAAQLAVADGVPVAAAVFTALLVSEFLLRSLATDRARVEEVMDLTEERANLLEQALTAEVAERAWIAGHVHDETLQTLAVARQDIEEAIGGERSALQTALEHLDSAVAELRRTLVHVHPASVAGQGLGPTLEVYAAQVLGRAGATWTVEVEPGAGEEHEALLYSLARELLGNAAKHSGASRVDLRIAREDRVVRLRVTDDGVGLAAGAAEVPGHFGLLTARHRVAAAGGRLEAASGPGRGCSVAVELPVDG